MGGATVFPKLGIAAPSIKGSAVLWFNLLKSGQYDYRMMHAGCPVLIGTKWICTKWMRSLNQVFRRPCDLFEDKIDTNNC